LTAKFIFPDKLLAQFEGVYKRTRHSTTHMGLPRPPCRVILGEDKMVRTFVFVELQAVKSTGVFRKYRTTGRSISVDYEVLETQYPADIEIKFRAKDLEELLTESRENGNLFSDRWAVDQKIDVQSSGRSVEGRFDVADEHSKSGLRERAVLFEVFEESLPASRLARLADPAHLAEWRNLMIAAKAEHARKLITWLAELGAVLATDEEIAESLDLKGTQKMFKDLKESLTDPRTSEQPHTKRYNESHSAKSLMQKIERSLAQLDGSAFPI
jgi:hypothetical protein